MRFESWPLGLEAGERADGLLKAREADSDDLMIWHWAAEFGTAIVLMVGAFLVMINVFYIRLYDQAAKDRAVSAGRESESDSRNDS